MRLPIDIGGLYNGMTKGMGNTVKCKNCGQERKVDPAHCLQNGWPKCHGQTMAIMPVKKGSEK